MGVKNDKRRAGKKVGMKQNHRRGKNDTMIEKISGDYRGAKEIEVGIRRNQDGKMNRGCRKN